MASFPTTRWTLIRQAVDQPDTEARQALESLCQQYCGPVLGFVRNRVNSLQQAEDITQGFFVALIERDLLGKVDADRGRFRTFLLHALRNYMSDVRDFETAQKRGNGRVIVSLDVVRHLTEPTTEQTPEQIFELSWVRTVLLRAMERLCEEHREAGKSILFDALRPLLDSGSKPGVRDIAESLQMSEPAVRVAVHRMRKRLGRMIRSEIAETVPTNSDVNDELQRLMQVLETQS